MYLCRSCCLSCSADPPALEVYLPALRQKRHPAYEPSTLSIGVTGAIHRRVPRAVAGRWRCSRVHVFKGTLRPS